VWGIPEKVVIAEGSVFLNHELMSHDLSQQEMLLLFQLY